jgi:hypothetical protein
VKSADLSCIRAVFFRMRSSKKESNETSTKSGGINCWADHSDRSKLKLIGTGNKFEFSAQLDARGENAEKLKFSYIVNKTQAMYEAGWRDCLLEQLRLEENGR